MAISNAKQSKDWFHRPAAWIVWRGLPIAIGISTMGLIRLTLTQAAFTWAVLFAWMGSGCLLNAWRCGRLHCFISGPVLWLGAIATALIGLRVITGSFALDYVVQIAAVLAALSFLPEWIWGRYGRAKT